MRRLAQVIAGVLALAAMLMYVPWELAECTPTNCPQTDMWDYPWLLIQMIGMQMLIYGIVATLVLMGVLGMRDPAATSEGAVLAALGQSKGDAVRTAAKTGALDAAVAVGGAFVITGAVHVWKVLDANAALGEAGGAWVARLTVGVVFAAALVGAHVVDAMRPRRSPIDMLHEDAAAPQARRFSLCARTMVFGGLAAVAAGVVAGVTLAHDPADGDIGETTRSVVQGAQITVWLSMLALAFAVGVPLAVKALRPAVAGAGRLAASLKAPRAAAILQARATTASGAAARTILAVFGLALLFGAVASTDPAPALTPGYVGTVSVGGTTSAEELADEYRAIEGVGTVLVAPMLRGDYSLVGVDLEEIAGLDPELAGLLTNHPGAMAAPGWMSGTSIYALAAVGINASGIVPISTCCSAFIERDRVDAAMPDSALLIYAAEGTNPADVAQAVGAWLPTTANSGTVEASLAYRVDIYSGSWGDYVVHGLVALVCAGPTIALAMGVANRRRRDDATLAALGATRRTLRGAAVAETSVVAAVAVGAGLLSGAVWRGVVAMVMRAQDSLDGVITDSYLEVALRSIDWGFLAWTFAIAVAIFAGIAWLISSRAPAKLPAEQLRTAHAGGIS